MEQPVSPIKDTVSVSTTSPAVAPVVTPAPTPIPITVPAISHPDITTKGSVDKLYYYIIDGTPGYIPLNVYTGVNDYIVSFGNIYTHDDYHQVINNEVQREYIAPMVKNIRLAAKDPDDEARVAISLVQHIKYDANTINEVKINQSEPGIFIGRYPYTILFQNWGGICGEKSFLLALLLKELGYGVALLEFDDVGHMAVGIKVPAGYSYKNTGYALIESTSPEIPTSYEYSVDDYKTRMSMLTPSKIITISDGKSFDTVDKEFADAQIQDTIHVAAADVIRARNTVIRDMRILKMLNQTVNTTRSQVRFDFQGNLLYDENYRRYQTALDEYNAYYNDRYLPDYGKFVNLFDNYVEVYVPEQRLLDKKYGKTSGFNVGL